MTGMRLDSQRILLWSKLCANAKKINVYLTGNDGTEVSSGLINVPPSFPCTPVILWVQRGIQRYRRKSASPSVAEL